jgi:Rrf2 family protein
VPGKRPPRGGLQLTRAADYAVRALIHLGTLPPGSRLSQQALSAAIGAPPAFVGKVLQQLAGAGLLTSHRGIGGGFALRPSSLQATMLDAVTAIDGPIALNTCLSPDEPCDRASFCPAHLVWFEAQRRVVDVLRCATIGALAAQARGETEIVPVATRRTRAPGGTHRQRMGNR